MYWGYWDEIASYNGILYKVVFIFHSSQEIAVRLCYAHKQLNFHLISIDKSEFFCNSQWFRFIGLVSLMDSYPSWQLDLENCSVTGREDSVFSRCADNYLLQFMFALF